MMKLTAGILRPELPVNTGTGPIALSFKGLDFSPQCRFIGNVLVQTLPAEHAQLNLGHIEPTAMLGSVVKLPSLENPSGLNRVKGLVQGLVQGSRPMPVEVVQH